MDVQALLLQLQPHETQKAEAYAQQLKASEDGWRICLDLVVRGVCRDEVARFICVHVVEHHIKTRYATSSVIDKQALRQAMLSWLQQNVESRGEGPAVPNKMAQIFALLLIADYPHEWPTFFDDILNCVILEKTIIDKYLRILTAIDEEVVDREIARSEAEAQRNTDIKDHMRVRCVPQLVNTWYQILTAFESSEQELVCSCLRVVGEYVEWIDIGLIANERFTSLLLRFMLNEVLRESACLCFHEILMKGTDPSLKVDLTASLSQILEEAHVLPPQDGIDPDFLASLSQLVSTMGQQLVSSYHKLTKMENHAKATEARQAINSKLPHMIKFLSDEGDDISQVMIPFAKSYIELLKKPADRSALDDQAKSSLEALVYVIIIKLKYDESYCFETEGEEEVMFQDYRKELKVLFDNIAQLNPSLLMETVYRVCKDTFERQQVQSMPFNEVEAALRVIYWVGEIVPGNHFAPEKPSLLKNLLDLVVTCRVSTHPHPEVVKQFLELAVCFEKYFQQNSQHISSVLFAFLDERGLRHISAHHRSRSAYLLSRFVRSHRVHLRSLANDVLTQLRVVLMFSPHNCTNGLLSVTDQNFLYEAAGMLVLASSDDAQKNCDMMKELISPLISQFRATVSELYRQQNPADELALATNASCIITFVGRVSKAFSSHHTMKQAGCVDFFAETLSVFLEALQINCHREILHSAVRQYLHRMIVCLENESLRYIPVAISHLLKGVQVRDIVEFVPLINQLILKFKVQIIQLLVEVFVPFIKAVFSFINAPAEQHDQQAILDKRVLHRAYISFLAALINNNLAQVISQQDVAVFQEVLQSIVQGCYSMDDPSTQKSCFVLLRKLVEFWGGEVSPQFHDFVYNRIVPACFLVPLDSTFNLKDAQTLYALAESGQLMQAVYSKRGDELMLFLRQDYLPSLSLSSHFVQEYCTALCSDFKFFRSFLRLFFTQLQPLVAR